jgi:5-methylcytosine-specific restriction endonuclease McrA
MRARICTRSGALYTTDRCNCSRCITHRTADNTRRLAKRRAHGRNTAAWQRLRLRRLKLDGYRCQMQWPGCTGKATTVHLHPRLNGDHRQAKITDLFSACSHCHGIVDAPRATRR